MTSKSQGGSDPSRAERRKFSSFESDPRFRLPSKNKTKTTIDKRFARLLKDDDFTGTSKVDRYGRSLKSDSKKTLERLYQRDDDEEEVEVDDDEVVRRELRIAKAKYDAARGGGFSSSDSDSDSDDDSDEGDVAAEVSGSMQKLQDEQAQVETGEVSRRIAIVNMDWDHIKAVDLFALFSSFLNGHSGNVEKVSIYPSEFGKERMRREETEGPPQAIFKPSAQTAGDDESEDSGQDSDDEAAEQEIKDALIEEGDDQDFDHDALRAYQLDRLRYYYAVMSCSDKETANFLYDTTDGTEYMASSNLIDLRFIPDDVTFDDEPEQECSSIDPRDEYKPIDFTTEALQHSKVKLTWDMTPDDKTRKDTINRKFMGTRKELEKNDLKAYLASGSEDEGDEPEENGAGEPVLTKKELARRNMRAVLGLDEEPMSKSSQSGPVGDMEITFAPALSREVQTKTEREETAIDKYRRKEKEHKERKREKARAKREGRDPDTGVTEGEVDHEPVKDLGFDDPFFTTEDPEVPSRPTKSKKERQTRREARRGEADQEAKEQVELQLLMADTDKGAQQIGHFNFREILKAEKLKKKGKKGKKGKPKEASQAVAPGLQENFRPDVGGDERFRSVLESHDYALDPSNPNFHATETMNELLIEGRKRKVKASDGSDEGRNKRTKKDGEEGLARLVDSVKRKAGRSR